MITIDSEARLREVILGLDVPADSKRSIYYDCKRGYSFEWGNEEQCDTPNWGRKRGQPKPPFTLVLPDGEGEGGLGLSSLAPPIRGVTLLLIAPLEGVAV